MEKKRTNSGPLREPVDKHSIYEPVMTASDVGDDCIHTWIKQILGPVHATVRRTVAWALLCLLLAQRSTRAPAARVCGACGAGGQVRHWTKRW